LCGHHDSTEIKVSVVRAILSKDLDVVANADGTAGGLLIDRNAYRAFVQLARNRAAGNASTPAEAAKALLCDAADVALIDADEADFSRINETPPAPVNAS
jgi:hypothetical protein